MADQNDKIKILEEKLKGLDDKSADGNLMIKIWRRPDMLPGSRVSGLMIACTLGGGSLAHVASPEVWLPRLMGGGSYVLGVFAPSSSGVALVEGIEVIFQGEPRQMPDLDAPDEESWKGPSKIIFPTKQSRNQSSAPTIIASPPSATTPNTTAPQTPLPGNGGSGGTHQDELRRLIEHQNAQMQALHAQIAEERRRAEAQLAEAERQREKERHARELETLKAQQAAAAEAQRKEMEAVKDMLKDLKSAPPPPKGPSLAESLKELLPIAVPLITGYMTASAERERRAEERQNEVLKTLQSRPAIDPFVKEMLESSRANELPMATFMQQSAQTTATLINQMAEMVKTMAEMNAGPEEGVAVKAIREVGNAIQGIASAAAGASNPAPRRLPRTETPDNVVPLRGEAPPRNAAMHGLDEQKAGSAPAGGLARIKALLEAQEDPEKVAKETLRIIETPEFQKAVEAAGGDLVGVFQNLMGEPWLTANTEYAQKFGQAFTRLAQLQVAEEEDDANDAEG